VQNRQTAGAQIQRVRTTNASKTCRTIAGCREWQIPSKEELLQRVISTTCGAYMSLNTW